MKYYLISGEASGDLHASHLIAAIKEEDAEAQFRGFGGDMMAAEGMELVRHYRDLAYMGIFPVLMHLRTILKGMKQCQEDILAWQPDVVILVDYPGFNLKIARFVKAHSRIPVFYYIAPKIWAWKEWRIKDIKRDIDALFSILPFEVQFFEEKHHYPIHYVGNPTVDEVSQFKILRKAQAQAEQNSKFKEQESSLPVIALLPGSRKQEVRDNLRRMIEAAAPYAKDYQLVIAAAPGLDDSFYKESIQMVNGKWLNGKCTVVRDQTYQLLQHSTAALVTSGTATLETALFRVPQVVCYYMKWGRLASLARRLVLKIPYISLVNLIAGEEVVPELVAEQMTAANVRRHLAAILPGGSAREAQLQGYDRMAAILGEPGAPGRAAKQIVRKLKNKNYK
ncbi:MAG: lipid-A-disaccharide synthase [Bacteroidaceae bacterium]|nr:lipid-A-disaccharide synthase [Bacteroidaceae bacterium]